MTRFAAWLHSSGTLAVMRRRQSHLRISSGPISFGLAFAFGTPHFNLLPPYIKANTSRKARMPESFRLLLAARNDRSSGCVAKDFVACGLSPVAKEAWRCVLCVAARSVE